MKYKKITSVFLILCLISASIFPFFGVAAIDFSDINLKINSVTWQDPENTVLIWDHTEGLSYRIYRCDTENGEYELIGTSSSGCYRDNKARYPKEYFYKIQPVGTDGIGGKLSEPLKSGTNPQKLSCVTVIMYHNFISEEDIKNGVEFEEYSISPSAFEEDLKYLKNNGYTTITSDDLIKYMHGEKPLPPKAVIISIDDGTLGVYKNAWPLLKKYKMKADFNVIGENIDAAWETIHNGGTRLGQTAPYCQWNELKEMCKSGEINLCSHTYGLHKYNRQKRVGMMINDGESIESYTEVIKEDFKLASRCITGWTDIVPKTVAYPYSKRNEITDDVILANTSYEVLMAGDSVRATTGNYFVDGAGKEGYLPLMNRPCRMDGYPIETYLKDAQKKDYSNGINKAENTKSLTESECNHLASLYSSFIDVNETDWFRGSVYYAYVNSLMSGTSTFTFEPMLNTSRGMIATLMYRLEGSPAVSGEVFDDVDKGQYYAKAVTWAAKNKLVSGYGAGKFGPDDPITREQMAAILYRYAAFKGCNTDNFGNLFVFNDKSEISEYALKPLAWAVSEGLVTGKGDGILDPKGKAVRAEIAAILMRFCSNLENK